MGKTALLGYLGERAADCRVLSVTGAPSKMELALAALHQLCGPILGELDELPGLQGEALRITFGVARRSGAGSVPVLFSSVLSITTLSAFIALS